MNPKLLDSVYFVPTPDGIVFRSGSDVLALQGGHLYAWFERLLPQLDGRRTLDAICARLSDARRAMVVSLLEPLIERGFVRDCADDEPDDLTDDERGWYASQLALVEAHAGSPGLRFQRCREASVLVVGAGEAPLSVLRAGLENGLRGQSFLATDAGGPQAGRLHEYLDEARRDDPGLELQWGTAPALLADPESWSRSVAGSQLVIAVLEDGNELWLDALLRACRSETVPFLPVVLGTDAALVGPLSRQTRGEPCVKCLLGWRMGESRTVEPAWGGTGIPAVAGALAVYEAFRFLTGIHGGEGGYQEVDRESWQIQRRPLLPLPGCTGCAGLTIGHHEWAAPEHTPPLDGWDAAACLKRVTGALADARSGLFATLEEGDLPQVPLRQCAARVRLPGTPAGARWVREVAADPVVARALTVLRGLELFVAAQEGDGGSRTDASPGSESAAVAAAPGEAQAANEAFLRALGRWSSRQGGWRSPLARERAGGTAAAAAIAEYLAAHAVEWELEVLEVGAHRAYRFLTGGSPVSVVVGSDPGRMMQVGLQDVWLARFGSAPGEEAPGVRYRAAVGSALLSAGEMERLAGMLELRAVVRRVRVEPLTAATGVELFHAAVQERPAAAHAAARPEEAVVFS
jgi:hypothetical protein